MRTSRVVRASWPRPPGPGGSLTGETRDRCLVGRAGRQLGANRGDVLVEFGGCGQIAGGYAVQDRLPDFVRQPQGDGGQRDRNRWIRHITTILTLSG